MPGLFYRKAQPLITRLLKYQFLLAVKQPEYTTKILHTEGRLRQKLDAST